MLVVILTTITNTRSFSVTCYKLYQYWLWILIPKYVAELVGHLTETHEALRQLRTEVRQKNQEEPFCLSQQISFRVKTSVEKKDKFVKRYYVLEAYSNHTYKKEAGQISVQNQFC